MASWKQHPAELRERAVAMVFELRAASGSSRGTLASVGQKPGRPTVPQPAYARRSQATPTTRQQRRLQNHYAKLAGCKLKTSNRGERSRWGGNGHRVPPGRAGTGSWASPGPSSSTETRRKPSARTRYASTKPRSTDAFSGLSVFKQVSALIGAVD